MFKMYFVKTDKPNVFKRVDALARVLLNKDIFCREDCLTRKQSDYYIESQKRNLLSWNELIGFTTSYSETVRIFNPIPDMIRIAKDSFDIDLCFVDKEPDIPFDKNVMIDVALDEYISHGKFCYWVSFGKYDMTDTLAIIHYENEIYDRIRNALNKYGLSEFEECIVSGNSWINPKLEKVMKKDFKENFNINLSVNHCTIADIYPTFKR